MKAQLPVEDIILFSFLQESEFEWQSKICSVKIKVKKLTSQLYEKVQLEWAVV